VAVLPEVSDSNKRGAGRPAWIPDQALPLDQAPDVLPGRYLVRYLKWDGASWGEVDRTEIILFVKAAPPAPGTQPSPERAERAKPSAPPAADPHGRIVDGALDLAGHGAGMQTAALIELNRERDALLKQLEQERERNNQLAERLQQAVLGRLDLGDLYLKKVQELADKAQTLPQPPGEPAYLPVAKATLEMFKDMFSSVAPGINAKLGALPALLTPPPLPPAAAALPPRARELVQQLAAQLARLRWVNYYT
jgi:hypothetical protein